MGGGSNALFFDTIRSTYSGNYAADKGSFFTRPASSARGHDHHPASFTKSTGGVGEVSYQQLAVDPDHDGGFIATRYGNPPRCRSAVHRGLRLTRP